MPQLSLAALDDHPARPNRMTRATKEKLFAHLRTAPQYPPLIVRPHPMREGRFEILDGHHRADALRRLGHEHATCEVWNADDTRSAMLLLTLNRLRGQDDPAKRGSLLKQASHALPPEKLERLVPDDPTRIRRLIGLTHAPQTTHPQRPPAQDQIELPHAVTFFLNGPQRRRLLDHLQQICGDRTEALVRLLALDEP